MVRTLGSDLGALLSDIHADEGVQVRLGVGVSYFRATSGRLSGVALHDGTILEADVELVAVGAEPNVEWLHGSGVPIGNGVLCDEFVEAFPNVYAAGDTCEWRHAGYDRRLRLEHRTNAAEQGRAAARNLLGRKEQFIPTPYFWTDHYEYKLQAYGRLGGGAETVVVEGSLADRKFVALAVADSRVVGAASCNMPREFRPYKQLAAECAPYPLSQR